MVTVYYLALMTNSSFALEWTRPYHLSDYFSVPSCNKSHAGALLGEAGNSAGKSKDVGNVGSSIVSPSSSSAQLPGKLERVIRNDVDKWKYFTNSLFLNDTGDVEVHTNSFHWREVVRNEVFRERAASLGLLDLSQAELFKLAIDRLFDTPTSAVRESFNSVLRRLADGGRGGDASEGSAGDGLRREESNVDAPSVAHEGNAVVSSSPSSSSVDRAEEANNATGPARTVSVSYVGVQIRLGGRNSGPVSGWDDPSRHPLEQVHCFAAEAVRLCRHMNINSIFVTADSEEALRVFEKATSRASSAACAPCPPPVVVHVPGSIGHTDRSSVAAGHARDVWLKSVLDWWALKHAKAMVVSRSAFGETAAASSGAEVAVQLKLSADSSRCEFQDVLDRDKDVFHWP